MIYVVNIPVFTFIDHTGIVLNHSGNLNPISKNIF